MFFRPATKEDFEGYEVQYHHFKYMSAEVKQLIEEDNFKLAVGKFRNETGMGMVDIRKYCEEYQKYCLAKKDFEEGKQVFVPY